MRRPYALTDMADDGLPDVGGCINLVTAFWDQVRGDLALWYPELDEHLERAHRDLTTALSGKGDRRFTKARNRAILFERRRRAILSTVEWIEREPGFLTWCGLSVAAPQAVRAHLREQFPGPFASASARTARVDPDGGATSGGAQHAHRPPRARRGEPVR